MRALFFAFLLLAASNEAGATGVSTSPDPIDQIMIFGGSRPNHIPPHLDTLSQDSAARRIARACLNGASRSDLDALHVQGLQGHLDRLTSLGLLTLKNDRYSLTIPVFAGGKRERLRAVANEGAARLVAAVEPMIVRLRRALKEHPEITFHMLWSRMIDANWWDLYRAHTRDQSTPPTVAWIVYPLHPFQVGTNFWSMPDEDELAVTWGYGCFDCVGPIQDGRPYLIGRRSARPSDSLMAALVARGCVNSAGVPLVYSYPTGGELDNLLDSLKNEYALSARNLYNYDALGKEFDVATDDLFVILMHETAYSLFENLDRSGKLPFPEILRGSTNRKLCVQLASIRRL